MDESSMDMTSINAMNDTRSELISTQDKIEVILQENHMLKRRIELSEKATEELENEVTFLNNSRAKDKLELEDKQNELDLTIKKITRLEALLEDERLNVQRLTKEQEDKSEKESVTVKPTTTDEGEIDVLIEKIQNLEVKLKEELDVRKIIEEDQTANIYKLKKLEKEKLRLLEELTETKQILNQKTSDIRHLNEAVEAIREEKLLLNSELQTLKSSDKNASRGNSLFAEVEENRQKVAAQREVLKLKYLNLKKVVSQKQVENNKLKLEIVKIRREDKDDEKGLHRDYSNLICTYKERVSELEGEVRKLKQNEQLVQVNSEDNSSVGWVQTLVENARGEAKKLQTELDRRGSNYVAQGHQLFDSQKENRRLKGVIAKMQSDLDELRLKLDTIKSGNETLNDGISPPVLEVAAAYQKQKIVKFKEILQQNISSSEDKNSESSGEPVIFNFNPQDVSLSEKDVHVKEEVV